MTQVFILSTHYPYGTREESFIATELQLLSELFDKVTLLPVKALPGRRTVPSNVDVLPALVGVQRWKFFLSQLARPQTWRWLASALWDAKTEGKLSPNVLPNCLKFACYRTGLAAHPRLLDFVRQPDDRIVYCYWAHLPALAALAANAHGLPTCVRYHSGDLYEGLLPINGYFYPWRNELRRKIDMHIFVSHNGLRYFLNLPNRPPPKRAEVHLLGSPDLGPPHPRKEADLSNLVMASLSTLIPTKRVHLIARLAQSLAKHGKVEWHHFGPGQDSDLDRVLERKVDGLTVVMHGDTPNAEIQRFFRRKHIDFFANMSLFEGVPVSVMEALNADIPVIATQVGGTPELVINGRSGFTLICDECLDSDALALRVRKELAPDGLLTTSSPRKTWEEQWNARTNTIKLFDALRSLL